MQTQQSAAFTAIPILTLKDLGFEGTVSLDQASRGLAERSEAQIIRWVQFPAGALFFVLVPGDPKSGALYVFDRRSGVFYSVDFNDQNWGGYSLAEYEALERTHRISRFAQRPWLLNRTWEPRKTRLINGPAVSFAQVLNPGYQKAGRKEEPS